VIGKFIFLGDHGVTLTELRARMQFWSLQRV
jgi:hypothetical protein